MPNRDVRLITYDPGHFHAALIQKEMYAGVSPRVHVYAPLGPDLLAHLDRIAAFNARSELPTAWELEVHTSADPLARLVAERPGNVVVLSGRNRGKIDAILAALEAGLHVLADKPWVIRVEDLPRLQSALDLAGKKGLAALDVMTERHEVTSQLQRELIHDPEVFGALDPGSAERPSVFLESEHYLCKSVAGVPIRRPAWFFDVDQAGEGLADVGTHLVDLVPWVLFPGEGIPVEEIRIGKASRVPTVLSEADFQKVTGEVDYAAFLAPYVISGQLLYYCNTTVSYSVRGVHVWLNVSWSFEAGPGIGDRHLARFRGTRSQVEVRQGAAEHFLPEVYVVPRDFVDLPGVKTAVRRRTDLLQDRYPGVGVEEVEDKLRLVIPEALRVGHEAHFAQVARQFLGYLDDPSTLPAWEKANMLAKYHVTTHGVRLAQADERRSSLVVSRRWSIRHKPNSRQYRTTRCRCRGEGPSLPSGTRLAWPMVVLVWSPRPLPAGDDRMFNELVRLRDTPSLFELLSHYAGLAAPDRQVWQDRRMQQDSCDARELTRLHGELIAHGWVEQNTGLTPVLRKGEAPACYRVTTTGLRALKQVKAGEVD